MNEVAVTPGRPKTSCPHCQKRVTVVGLREHVMMMHEGGAERAAKDAWVALDDRVLTEAELREIELRSDLDYLDRRLTKGRMRRALKDREMLLCHIRALRGAQQRSGDV